MALVNDVSELLPGGLDHNGNFRRAIDKDRASGSLFHTYVANGSSTFLTVPTGAKAHLLGMVINNKEILGPISISLLDAAVDKIAGIVVQKASSVIGETVVLTEDDLRGYTFETTIVATIAFSGAVAVGCDVSIAWWIEPAMAVAE
ncbi:hypothetical protein M0R72_05965 [Candidatus Pacearchaeota archaeon]|jgi:hypothetical protein|nr:hypothetical protein [Candidatus Pacearchaeota archaeon]